MNELPVVAVHHSLHRFAAEYSYERVRHYALNKETEVKQYIADLYGML